MAIIKRVITQPGIGYTALKDLVRDREPWAQLPSKYGTMAMPDVAPVWL